MAVAEKKSEDKSKVIDKDLGIDYTYLLNKGAIDTLIVSEEEIAEEDNELVASFLSANADVKPYIDKSIFDPQGAVAKHIINLCKDMNYKVKVGEKEYRLPQAIMLMAMSDCYNYVTSVAKALAEKSGNKSCIQLSDADVYAIAENYFKHGGRKVEIKITDETKKSASKTIKPSAKKPTVATDTSVKANVTPVADDVVSDDDLPYEIKDEPVKEEPKSEQISFFDL